MTWVPTSSAEITSGHGRGEPSGHLFGERERSFSRPGGGFTRNDGLIALRKSSYVGIWTPAPLSTVVSLPPPAWYACWKSPYSRKNSRCAFSLRGSPDGHRTSALQDVGPPSVRVPMVTPVSGSRCCDPSGSISTVA